MASTAQIADQNDRPLRERIVGATVCRVFGHDFVPMFYLRTYVIEHPDIGRAMYEEPPIPYVGCSRCLWENRP